MPCFDDPFRQRAQLFVAMLIGRFQNDPKLPPALLDQSEMTVMTDYLIPMAVHRMGILEYSAALEAKIERGELLPKNSPEEKELRAATILAADQLLNAIRSHPGYEKTSILALDSALWFQAQEIPDPSRKMPE